MNSALQRAREFGVGYVVERNWGKSSTWNGSAFLMKQTRHKQKTNNANPKENTNKHKQEVE